MPITILAGLLLAAAPTTSDDATATALYFCAERHIRWLGSVDDRRTINAVPVPKHFKAIWQRAQHSCESFDRDSFLEWHLKFGNEQSTLGALVWVEAESLRDANASAPAEFMEEWNPAGQGYAVTHRLVDSGQLASYELLAGEYLRAAEFFHSPKLLAKSKPYIDAVSIGLDDLYPDSPVLLQTTKQAGNANVTDYQLNAHREFDIRYAVEKAYQTGNKHDISVAQQMLDRVSGGQNMMVLAANLAENTSDGNFCNRHERDFTPDALMQACKSENGLDGRVTRYWRNRAMLDEAFARTDAIPVYGSYGGGQTALEIAVYFLRQNLPTGNQSIREIDSEQVNEIAGLYLAAANTERICARTSRSDSQYGCNRSGNDPLSFAEELISPVTNPNRIRQIAAAYEEICRQPNADGPDPCAAGSELGRQTAFMRIVASHLDELDDDVSHGSPAAMTATKPESR